MLHGRNVPEDRQRSRAVPCRRSSRPRPAPSVSLRRASGSCIQRDRPETSPRCLARTRLPHCLSVLWKNELIKGVAHDLRGILETMNGEERPVHKDPFRLHGDRNAVGDAFDHRPIDLYRSRESAFSTPWREAFSASSWATRPRSNPASLTEELPVLVLAPSWCPKRIIADVGAKRQIAVFKDAQGVI